MKLNVTTMLRLIFYPFFLVSFLICFWFVCNPIYAGVKAYYIKQAYLDIFAPIKFKQIEPFLLRQAAEQVIVSNAGNDVEILEINNDGEQMFLVCYRLASDAKGVTRSKFIRIEWKPWAYL